MRKYWEKVRNLKQENRRVIVTKVLSGALIVTGGLLLSGCTSSFQKDSQEQVYIAVIGKCNQHEFWKNVEQGARDAGEEIDAKITFEAPKDEGKIMTQVELVKKAIENKADAIVLAPLDVEKLNGVIEEAKAKKIPVLTLDSDAESEDREAHIGTDNMDAGSIAARKTMELLRNEGTIAIVSHVEGAQTAVARNEGFIKEIEKEDKKSMPIIAIEYSEGDPVVAEKQTRELIRKYPDLGCIYATNEGSTVGVANAIKELDKQDDITLIGFDSSEQEITYLEEGVIDGIMVQNPYNMGYLGVRNIHKVLENESIEEKINTGATYVNRNNLMDDDTQWLLYPMGK